jgi:hypothetical protein
VIASTYDFPGLGTRKKPGVEALRRLQEFYSRPRFDELLDDLDACVRPPCCIVTGDTEQPSLSEPGSHSALHKHHLTDTPSRSPFDALVYLCERANNYLNTLRFNGVEALNSDNAALHPRSLMHRVFRKSSLGSHQQHSRNDDRHGSAFAGIEHFDAAKKSCDARSKRGSAGAGSQGG